jgi:hypothetical protein
MERRAALFLRMVELLAQLEHAVPDYDHIAKAWAEMRADVVAEVDAIHEEHPTSG